MMEFRNWKMDSPEDVDIFDLETQENHRSSLETVYATGEPQSRVNREQFLAHLRELTQEETKDGPQEAWSCQEYQCGGPTLFECWTSTALNEQTETETETEPEGNLAFW